jgi:magnesium transporter
MVRTRSYRGGKLQQENFPVEKISDELQIPGTTVWFDLCGSDSVDLDVISQELGLHELAVEDVRDPHQRQRPKLDHYPEHLFLVAFALEMDPTTSQLRAHEINVFVTKNAVVTVREDEGFNIDEVVSRWDGAPNLAGDTVAFLLHGVLDYVVDTHFEAIQELDTEIDGLEDQLFDDITTDKQLQRRTFELRKDLVKLRRLVLPMREVVNTVMRRDLGVVTDRLAPYFQDVYDHVLRATEWTESLRDLVANILETRLTVRGNRLNVIMRQVTSWAAIIAVPTAVTGFYGQNLPYPGFQEKWGFWMSLSILITGSGGLFLFFKAKDWL